MHLTGFGLPPSAGRINPHMLRSACRYSFVNARARGLRSRRLTPEDWHFLTGAHSLEALLRYLSTTSYARFVPETTGEFPARKIVERMLYRSLMEDYSIIVRALRGRRERAVILALFSRFEGENLKIMLRAIFSGRTRQEVEYLLYPLGRISRIPWEELWRTGSVEEIMGRLSRTVFGPALRYAFPQFEAQGRLFPLEMAIDQATFRQISERVGVLPRSDRRAAAGVAGSLTDMLNVSWIIRLRVRYGFRPEQIINYTLPGGKLLTLPVIRRLVLSADMEEFADRLPGPLAQYAGEASRWEDVVPRLHIWFLQMLRRVFRGQPFNLGVETACLLEEEMEIQRLTGLIEAKSQVASPGPSARRLMDMVAGDDPAGEIRADYQESIKHVQAG